MPIVAVTDPSRVPDGTACADTVVGLVAHIRALGPQRDVLLVSHTQAGEALARSARLACGERTVGLLHVPMTATSFYVTAAALRMLPDEALGLASVVTTVLAGATWTRVLVSRLGEPETPAPSFGQRVRGAFPGARFVVDPVAGVITGEESLIAPPGVVLVEAHSEPLDKTVDLAGSGAPQLRLELGAAWRARRWAEVTVVTRGLDEIVSHTLHPHSFSYYSTCTACARTSWGERCLFCQVPLLVRDDFAIQNIGGIQ